MLKSILLGLLATACYSLFAQNPTVSPPNEGKHFGARITAEGATAYEDLLAKMAEVDSLPIKLVGTVKEVCQKKGCWMTLVSDQPGYPEMRVTFKDYAFFMPKDLSGRRVVVDGFAQVTTTSVEVLRHFAEDAKKSPEEIAAITEPKREVAFEAAGVVIVD